MVSVPSETHGVRFHVEPWQKSKVNPDEVLSTVARLALNIGLKIGEEDFSSIQRAWPSQFGYLGETEGSAFTVNVPRETHRGSWGIPSTSWKCTVRAERTRISPIERSIPTKAFYCSSPRPLYRPL